MSNRLRITLARVLCRRQELGRSHRVVNLLVILLLAVSFGRSASAAVVVNIDPASYAGVWHISGVLGSTRGPAQVSLNSGAYTLVVGEIGTLNFSLAPDGTVSVSNGAAATGGMGSLTFNTTSINVNPLGYAGSWLIRSVTERVRGTASVILVPGLSYKVTVGEI